MSLGVGIGLGIGGLLLAVKAWLTQPPGAVKPREMHSSPSTKPRGDLRESIWCDRIIDLPDRACSTICDHELKHLALSIPDAICRAKLQEMEYQFFGDAQNDRAPE